MDILRKGQLSSLNLQSGRAAHSRNPPFHLEQGARIANDLFFSSSKKNTARISSRFYFVKKRKNEREKTRASRKKKKSKLCVPALAHH